MSVLLVGGRISSPNEVVPELANIEHREIRPAPKVGDVWSRNPDLARTP